MNDLNDEKLELIRRDKMYYELLNCTRQADCGQLKAEYRALALENHPDKSGGDKANEEKFKNATLAFKVLGGIFLALLHVERRLKLNCICVHFKNTGFLIVDAELKKLYDAYLASELSITFAEFKRLKETNSAAIHWAAAAQQPTLTDGQSQSKQDDDQTARKIPTRAELDADRSATDKSAFAYKREISEPYV